LTKSVLYGGKTPGILFFLCNLGSGVPKGGIL
jgi:hypothetical protein